MLQIDELRKSCEVGTEQHKVYEQLYVQWQVGRKSSFKKGKTKGAVSQVLGLNRFQIANDVRNHQEDTKLCLSKVEFGELLDRISLFYPNESVFGKRIKNAKQSQTCGLDLHAVYMLLFSIEDNGYVSSLNQQRRRKLDLRLEVVKQEAQDARVVPWSASAQADRTHYKRHNPTPDTKQDEQLVAAPKRHCSVSAAESSR